jgi:ribonuclease HII
MSLLKNFYFNKNEVGIDEAGRGPLLGRVYAGAVIWDPSIITSNNKIIPIINDSKKLTSKKRKIVFEWIKENLIWSVGYATVEEIENINILNATKLAMDRAIENFNDYKYEDDSRLIIKDIIIDGIGWENIFNSDYNIKSIIKGDANYYSIACASIIAKEYHDNYILKLCIKHPELNDKYNISKNMGYPTKEHINGINTYGITKYHRQTYTPCNKYNKKIENFNI